MTVQSSLIWASTRARRSAPIACARRVRKRAHDNRKSAHRYGTSRRRWEHKAMSTLRTGLRETERGLPYDDVPHRSGACQGRCGAGEEAVTRTDNCRSEGHAYYVDDRGSGRCMNCGAPMPSVSMLRDTFHAHLDECIQCRENPFCLCTVGASLLGGSR